MLSVVLSLAQLSSWPQTKAEITNYEKTSSHQEVIAFLDGLKAKGADFGIETIGKSEKGKDIPMVVVPNLTPGEAKAQKRIVIYVQANIHAGEVEGKEASLMMMRELAKNPDNPILKEAVFLFVPIYNADGNDAWGPNLKNRGHQDGPDPVGERENGMGLDLNRDCMKAESPEFRSVLLHVYSKWNPHVVFDLHTTNGTRHGFLLTYSPALNPTTDIELLRYSRDLLDKVRGRCEADHGWKIFDYGDAANRGGRQVFETFAPEPRYVTNYAGVRNRIAILSEAASFQPFKSRVLSTKAFVWDCVNDLVRDRRRVLEMTARADADSLAGKEIGIKFAMDSRGLDRVPLEERDPENIIPPNKAPIKYREHVMPIFDRFKVTQTSKAPMRGWAIEEGKAAVLLSRHGIKMERLTSDREVQGREFKISQIAPGANFQGHKLFSLVGAYQAANKKLAKGTYFVPIDQPLGLLAFHLLTPESTDGAIAWGFFGDSLPVNTIAPVFLVD